MKSKKELTQESKAYFKAYPKEDAFLTTGDGNFFPASKASQAKSYEKQSKGKLITITREEAEASKSNTAPPPAKGNEPPKGKDAVLVPEGDPSKDWTKDQLIAYGAQEYPDLKLTKSMKEDTILAKLGIGKKAAEKAKEESSDDSNSEESKDSEKSKNNDESLDDSADQESEEAKKAAEEAAN